MSRQTTKTQARGSGVIAIGIALVLFALLVSGIFAISAMALMVLWSGFMVPVFGLPLLSFGEAFAGVILIWLVGNIFGARTRLK